MFHILYDLNNFTSDKPNKNLTKPEFIHALEVIIVRDCIRIRYFTAANNRNIKIKTLIIYENSDWQDNFSIYLFCFCQLTYFETNFKELLNIIKHSYIFLQRHDLFSIWF